MKNFIHTKLREILKLNLRFQNKEIQIAFLLLSHLATCSNLQQSAEKNNIAWVDFYQFLKEISF